MIKIFNILYVTCSYSRIRNVKLAGNEIDTKASNIITLEASLGNFLENTKVEYLYLADMEINANLYTKLALGLQDNKYLISLDLSGNDLSSLAAATTLAEAIEKHKSLEHLNLSDNNLYKSGFIAILRSIRENTVLSNLNLSGNNILTKRENTLLNRLGELYDDKDKLNKKLNENTERLQELSNQYDTLDNMHLINQLIHHRSKLLDQYFKEKDELINEYNKQKGELDKLDNELNKLRGFIREKKRYKFSKSTKR